MNIDSMVYVWLALIVAFGIVEAATVGLTSIWFAAGALIAMLAAAVGASIWVQIILFIVSSAALLIFTRRIVKKFITPKIEPTNVDALIGQTAIVCEAIDNDAGKGQVRVDGNVWSARSEYGTGIELNEKVQIVRIEGVKLIVRI